MAGGGSACSVKVRVDFSKIPKITIQSMKERLSADSSTPIIPPPLYNLDYRGSGTPDINPAGFSSNVCGVVVPNGCSSGKK